ncbi:MAG: carboxypeptidase-like regulatory domain-containing protein, partial [Acidobacteria bacterium]|nr:carboxypeptidase-like regulatory domain-containing protein [Acidobacteriota bacterium]
MAGFVLDLQEQQLAGVVVSLRNRTIGVGERAVITGSTGKFLFSNLPPAEDYLLRASFSGFATIEIRIEIRPGRRTTQHISMRPERDLAEVIEVVGKGNIVQLEDTTTSTSFQSEFIEGLPVIGREYQDV